MSSRLRIPLEVLERILFFAFLPLASPSSSSPVTSDSLVAPPFKTSRLLIVSRGVRQLALPLYLSVVSIAREADWERFLDPGQGLLVVDARRKNFVKQLWINVANDAQIPFDVDYVETFLRRGKEPSRVLVELKPVALPRVDRLVFFKLESEEDVYVNHIAEEYSYHAEEDIEPLWVEIFFKRYWTREGGRHVARYSRDSSPFFTEEWDKSFYNWLGQMVNIRPDVDALEEKASADQSDAIKLFLPPSIPLPQNIDAVFCWKRTYELELLESRPVTASPIRVHPPLLLDFFPDGEDAVGIFRDQNDYLGSTSDDPLQFEGMPDALWEQLREGKGYGWGAAWTWTKEDGTSVGRAEMLAARPSEDVKVNLSLE